MKIFATSFNHILHLHQILPLRQRHGSSHQIGAINHPGANFPYILLEVLGPLLSNSPKVVLLIPLNLPKNI